MILSYRTRGDKVDNQDEDDEDDGMNGNKKGNKKARESKDGDNNISRPLGGSSELKLIDLSTIKHQQLLLVPRNTNNNNNNRPRGESKASQKDYEEANSEHQEKKN